MAGTGLIRSVLYKAQLSSEVSVGVGNVACLEYGNVAGTPIRGLVSPGDFAGVLSHILVVCEGDRTEKQGMCGPGRRHRGSEHL